MRLKTIKLAGFKSFVDLTSINFPNNLCAIVGPNGCGKSNIIDAVRWVMGERSAKNLRGESANDIIFNGSSSRQPVGQASIELIFDNHNQTLTGEYAAYNEISIRRKLSHDAQSIYYLNGQKCRRRDVTDLFLGTGLGPRSYAIIEQGMISQLIESRPEDLRIYIEQAAGISRYKERRRETANRISRTRENLARLQDLQQELVRQLATLQQQADAARRYTKLKQHERQHQSQLAALQWHVLRQQQLQQCQQMRAMDDHINLHRGELAAQLAQLDVNKQQLTTLTDACAEQQSRFYRLGADIARLEQTLEHRVQQRQQRAADIVELDRQLQRITAVLDTDTTELAHLKQQGTQLQPDINRAQQKLEQVTKSLDDCEVEQRQWQQQWHQKARQHADLQRQLEVTQTTLQQYHQQAQQLQDDLQKGRQELQQLSPVPEPQLDALQAELQHLNQQQQRQQVDLGALEQQYQQQRQQAQAQSAAIDQQKVQLSQGQGQLASLELLLAENQQVGAKLPAKWADANNQQLLQTLTVDSGWEAAAEQVLCDWLSAHCVRQLPKVTQAELQQHAGLRLLITEVSDQGSHHDAERLLDKVTSSADMNYILAHIYVADNLAQAQQLLTQLPSHASVILPSGCWLGHNWLRIPPSGGVHSGVLERKQQFDQLQQQVAHWKEALQLHEQRQQQERDALLGLEQALTQKRIAVRQLEQHQQKCRQNLVLAQQQQQQYQSQRERLEQRLDRQNKRWQALQQQRDRLNQQVTKQQRQLAQSQATLPDLESTQKRLQIALQSRRQSHVEAQRHMISLQARMDSISTQSQSLDRSIVRLQEQKTECDVRRNDIINRDQHQKDVDEHDLHMQLEALLQQRLASETELQQQRQAMTKLEQDISTLNQQHLRKQHALQQQQQQLQNLQLEEKALDVNQKLIKKQQQAQNIQVEQLAEQLPTAMSVTKLEQLLQHCQVQIKKLGAINLVAIDEYNVQQQRMACLEQQQSELQQALDTLEQAMRKIDRETRARFRQTFTQLKTSFGQLFPKVFGGGQASLELTDDDLLATGVTIMAQPPGKRNSNIHVLSGGEKALTAIALVFSIFKLNPAPFCMLDEVDAPLDDANVERYAQLLQDMSSKVQFIYTSHNKITMEMAHQLVGITMQEPGVSRLVAVDIDSALKLASEIA